MNRLRLPGTTGNYVSAPDSAALSITGDLDLRARIAFDDWTPAAAPNILGKDNGAARSYDLYLNTDGKLHVYVSQNAGGSIFGDATCSVATGFADGSVQWVRGTWRQSDKRVQFFTAPGSLTNPVAADFTQLGTDQTANITTIFDGAFPVELGSVFSGTALLAIGNLYRAQFRSGLDGTLVADFDAAAVKKTGTRTPTTFTDSVGVVWTVNGSAWDWVRST